MQSNNIVVKDSKEMPHGRTNNKFKVTTSILCILLQSLQEYNISMSNMIYSRNFEREKFCGSGW